MEPQPTSCELPGAPATKQAGSRVLRFQGDFRWAGVPVDEYKQAAADWCGVRRMSLAGESGESTRFHVRYFEIGAGGYSSLERHVHEHVVIVLRGRGEVQLDDATHALAFGDTVYVAPSEPHQFRNLASEPFGFLCIVDADRDRPVPVTRESRE